MRDLIDDILDYASSQLGAKMPLHRSTADLGEIAGDVVRQIKMAHPDRQFRTALEGDLAGEWDVSRIRQGLMNLIDNAVQHGEAGSAVTVSASGNAGGGGVAVSVHNVGAPIPAEERELIFQAFERGAATGRAGRPDAGSRGLGLYIGRRMAEAHGGSLEVESSREDGTTFTIRLPRHAHDGSEGPRERS